MSDYKDYKDQLKFLSENRLLPDAQYISAQRFTKNYQNTSEFYEGIGQVGYLPILNGITAIYYATMAVWATLRAVGNLLILKPGYAADAAMDLGFNLMLSIGLAVMAPIHALTSLIELLTRTISSWFTGQEPVADLSKLNFAAKWSEQSDIHKGYLPSSTYFTKSRFFSPYRDVLGCLSQAAAPVVSVLCTGIGSLYQAVHAISEALSCISNLIICKPRHALENARDCGIHISLALSLAVMTVINALVESIAFVTRLGTTWGLACMQTEPAASNPEIRAPAF